MSEKTARDLETVKCLERAYVELLQIAPGSEWRLANQEMLCALRDDIAALTHGDAQLVQDAMESIARRGRQ